MTEATGEVAAAQLHLCRRAGTGPPLVLAHGGVSDSRQWRDQLEELSDEFTVIAWDAPGCGGSSDPPEPFRLTEYADCLAGFVVALGLHRPCILGHSFGGGLALEPHSIPGLFSAAMAPEEVALLLTVMSEARPVATRTMAQAFAEADLRDLLPQVTVPTLLIYGDADVRAPRPVADQLHQAIPGAELVLLPGAGHESYLETPGAFNAEVRRFLRSLA